MPRPILLPARRYATQERYRRRHHGIRVLLAGASRHGVSQPRVPTETAAAAPASPPPVTVPAGSRAPPHSRSLPLRGRPGKMPGLRRLWRGLHPRGAKAGGARSAGRGLPGLRTLRPFPSQPGQLHSDTPPTSERVARPGVMNGRPQCPVLHLALWGMINPHLSEPGMDLWRDHDTAVRIRKALPACARSPRSVRVAAG